MTSKLACAIAAVLASTATRAADSQDATDSIAEITVTAQRREQNIQDVPIAMQALTAAALRQLNVGTFDDYLKYLPNVNSANNGPGQSEIFMRGVSAGSIQTQGGGYNALWPNVAIYIDNQSGQLPGRNLDVYAADLDRIEVLEGPQGTLFGAGAEAGAIRYITNQPKLDVTEGSVKGGYGTTAHGDPNTDLTAVLNVPVIENVLGLRGVIYTDRRGGYIDNVNANFNRKNTDLGIPYANYPAVNGQCPDGQPNSGYCVPPGSPSLDNSALAANAINSVTYTGIRVEGLYKINDDWNVLLSQTYQNMEADGVFYQQPNASDGQALAPLEVTLFNPTYDKDRFESTAWTLNGKLGSLKAVYTGGYLVRNVEQVGDYTNYARGVYADYYQCYGPTAYDSSLTPKCFSPSSSWHEAERNTHQQHEFRLTTPDDWRARGIVGAYWEDNRLYDQTDWRYRTVPTCTATLTTGCFAQIGPFPGTTVQNHGLASPNSSFLLDTLRVTKQLAFFASADFDLIPKTLTLTLGTRHYRFDNESVGSVISSFGCFEAGTPPGGCHNPLYSNNLDAQNLRDTERGFRSRGNLTWHITRDIMAYYTYSQGFRPGGFNPNGNTLHATGPDGVAQYAIPTAYASDQLDNHEIGWKTELLDHHLQWNGAVYRDTWKNAQVAFFNPGVLSNYLFSTNGQNFLIKGIETSVVGRVSGLTLQAAAAWNQSEQTNSPQLIVNNPASINYGKPLTQVCSATGTNCSPVTNPFGPIGSPTANSPPVQFSLRARYDLSWQGYNPFVQAGVAHIGHALTQAGANPTLAEAGAINTAHLQFNIPAYTTVDASIGISKDAWTVTLFGENLANSNAATFISTNQFIIAETPLRPRILGITMNYHF